MAIQVDELLKQMLGAAKNELGKHWPAIKDLAGSQFKQLAQNAADIELMKAKGTITEQQAKLLMDMQKNTLKTILLAEEGLGLLAAEAAINAAIDVVSGTINKTIGWSIL